METTAPEVLIVAEGEWYAVCRLPRVFHRAGVKASLLVLPRALARRTRHAHSLPMEGYDARDVVKALHRHLQKNPDRYAMIIPGDDMIVRALTAEPDKSWLRPWFPVEPTPKNLELITSKAAMMAACRQAGLPVPADIPCTTTEEALGAAEEIGYPVFVKGEESSGGTGVGRAQTEAELRVLLQTLPAACLQKFSIQQAINGQIGSSAVFSWQGEAVQWDGGYKRDVWPFPYGYSSQRECLRHPDLDLLAREISRITGFHGFFGIDWMHCTETGRLYLIEMNPRPVPHLHLSPRDGVDFSDGLRHILCNGPKPLPQPLQPARGLHPMFPQYLFRCFDKKDVVGFSGWLLQGLRGRSDIPWDDRALAIGMLKKLGRHCRRKLRTGKSAR